MASVNGLRLLSATVTMPRVGSWYLDCDVDSTDPLTGSATSEIDGVSFVGTVLRSGTHGGRVQARIVGGAGGLAKKLGAQHYANSPTAKTILTDILRGAGETLSSTADTALLSTQFARWQRDADTAAECMVALLDALGATWRVLADGTTWIGVDTYPEQTLEFTLIDERFDTGDITIAPDAPELRPGVTFRGQRIEEVVHSLTAGKLRTEARPNSIGSTLERLLAPLRRRIAYSRSYAATVVVQNSDDTLQLLPDDSLMKGAGLDKVPIRFSMPGMTLEVRPGDRVMFSFEGGSPALPYVFGWEKGSGTIRIGQILISQNASTFAVLPPQFFPAGLIGDVAAEVARVAASAQGPAFLVPIESGVWDDKP